MKKTVLITGGSKGIGFATAACLLQNQMSVILVARDSAGLEAAVESLTEMGHSLADIHTLALDIGDSAALDQLNPVLSALEDGLFGLVNNAAAETLKTIEDYHIQDLEKMWKVNMLAPVLLIQKCLPHLKQAKGSVVNIGSVSDRKYTKLYSFYGATKAFLESFTKHAARELGFEGVRINSVTPGGVDTPLMHELEPTFPPELIRSIKAAIPMGQRWGYSEEIAETILFALTGPEYLCGADLRVHGGSEQ